MTKKVWSRAAWLDVAQEYTKWHTSGGYAFLRAQQDVDCILRPRTHLIGYRVWWLLVYFSKANMIDVMFRLPHLETTPVREKARLRQKETAHLRIDMTTSGTSDYTTCQPSTI